MLHLNTVNIRSLSISLGNIVEEESGNVQFFGQLQEKKNAKLMLHAGVEDSKPSEIF